MNILTHYICYVISTIQTKSRHIICQKSFSTAKDTKVDGRYGRWFNPPDKRDKYFQGFPRRLDWPLPKNFQDKKNSCSSKNSICIIACLSIFPSIVLFIRPYNYTSVLSVSLFYLSIFFIYLAFNLFSPQFNLFSPTGLKLLPIPCHIHTIHIPNFHGWPPVWPTFPLSLPVL